MNARAVVAIILLVAASFLPMLLVRGFPATLAFAGELLLALALCAIPIVAIAAIVWVVRWARMLRLESRGLRPAEIVASDEFDSWRDSKVAQGRGSR